MSVAAALLVALALVLIPLGLLLLMLWREPPDPATQPKRANWLYLLMLSSWSVFAWQDRDRLFGIVVVVMNLFLAIQIVVHASNWHGWGRRLAESHLGRQAPPLYVQPSGWMHTALLAAALLSLVSDALFLGLRVR